MKKLFSLLILIPIIFLFVSCDMNGSSVGFSTFKEHYCAFIDNHYSGENNWYKDLDNSTINVMLSNYSTPMKDYYNITGTLSYSKTGYSGSGSFKGTDISYFAEYDNKEYEQKIDNDAYISQDIRKILEDILKSALKKSLKPGIYESLIPGQFSDNYGINSIYINKSQIKGYYYIEDIEFTESGSKPIHKQYYMNDFKYILKYDGIDFSERISIDFYRVNNKKETGSYIVEILNGEYNIIKDSNSYSGSVIY